MVMDRDCMAVKLLGSFTLKVTEIGPPAVVGVPEITPLALREGQFKNDLPLVNSVAIAPAIQSTAATISTLTIII
jgi:hypothetical protein